MTEEKYQTATKTVLEKRYQEATEKLMKDLDDYVLMREGGNVPPTPDLKAAKTNQALSVLPPDRKDKVDQIRALFEPRTSIPLVGPEQLRESIQTIYSDIWDIFRRSHFKRKVLKTFLDNFLAKDARYLVGESTPQVRELKKDVEKLDAKFQTEKKLRENAERKRDEYKAQLDIANDDNTRLKNENAALRKENDDLKEREAKRIEANPREAEDLTRQHKLKETQSELNSRTSQLATTKQQLADSKAEADAAQGRVANLMVQNEQLISEKAEITKERDAAVAENARWRAMQRNEVPGPSRPENTIPKDNPTASATAKPPAGTFVNTDERKHTPNRKNLAQQIAAAGGSPTISSPPGKRLPAAAPSSTARTPKARIRK